MSKQQSLDALEVSLAKNIDDWMQQQTENNETDWEAVGWVGENLHVEMAKAAMCCLRASADVQATIELNGVK